MSGPLRQHRVIGQLLATPQQYCWRQAVRLLLGWLHQQGVPTETALTRSVRFVNSVSPAFPASQIEAISVEGSLANPDQLRFRITPTFMGFLGNHGALPSHYSERIAHHQTSLDDAAPRAFLDLFSSRALTLFYQAWEKYRIEQGQAQQQFLPQLLALAGHHPCPALDIAPSVIGLYSGLLQQRQLSATVMARILADHFGVPVTVLEATGAMLVLAPREQTALGGANALLGQRATLGERCLRPDLAVTVRIGPLNAAQHAQFLPRTNDSVQLAQLLKLFGQPLLQYRIELVLDAGAVRGVTLGRLPESGLGYNTFLCPPAHTGERDDMHYCLQLMPALPD
ncbi:type VI secretion system baseplate subunit TssG [Janthinobacterium aquaticum]|uniref:type VI secretion system baseplate subunit TssG n=1 Tax=Janthinobacterium sp. FT58W TaxID=2654254 RepID=UPI0012655F0D|nr:type VI secretion system baseplate subunit TssG [Janthinobacterium sp. FT58W]KAB8042318.1 type VI secretion system baseplate subunit TssG [Janthinobacterium sp. FT58W]